MRTRRPLVLATAAATAVLALVAAGCGSAGSPDVAGTTSTTAASGALAFAACMRSHGVADFPDPDSDGTIDLKGVQPRPGSDLDPDSPAFETAQKACKALQPRGFLSGPHAVSPAERRQALAFSRCMRAHGLPAFPDPGSSGRLGVQAIRSAGIDGAAPQFQAALKACGQVRPQNIHFPGS
jgi:hypothetical protein